MKRLQLIALSLLLSAAPLFAVERAVHLNALPAAAFLISSNKSPGLIAASWMTQERSDLDPLLKRNPAFLARLLPLAAAKTVVVVHDRGRLLLVAQDLSEGDTALVVPGPGEEPRPVPVTYEMAKALSGHLMTGNVPAAFAALGHAFDASRPAGASWDTPAPGAAQAPIVDVEADLTAFVPDEGEGIEILRDGGSIFARGRAAELRAVISLDGGGGSPTRGQLFVYLSAQGKKIAGPRPIKLREVLTLQAALMRYVNKNPPSENDAKLYDKLLEALARVSQASVLSPAHKRPHAASGSVSVPPPPTRAP